MSRTTIRDNKFFTLQGISISYCNVQDEL